jgi:hypothetical protein
MTARSKAYCSTENFDTHTGLVRVRTTWGGCMLLTQSQNFVTWEGWFVDQLSNCQLIMLWRNKSTVSVAQPCERTRRLLGHLSNCQLMLWRNKPTVSVAQPWERTRRLLGHLNNCQLICCDETSPSQCGPALRADTPLARPAVWFPSQDTEHSSELLGPYLRCTVEGDFKFH